MQWRCEWCGKPHDENDPPCDNCGHGTFEEAVVQQTDLADDGQDGQDSMMVWVCSACGREHPKHSPPCSRCGNANLERQSVEIDDAELSSPGYLDLATPKYLAVLGVTLVIAAVVVLGFAGVIDLPGFGNSGVPDVENVPGNATTAGTISLAETEVEFLETLNDRRTEQNSNSLQRSDHLDDVARFYNQRWVKSVYGDGTTPDVRDLLEDDCSSQPVLNRFQVPETGYQNTDKPGVSVAELRLVQSGDLAQIAADTTGIDMHVGPDGRLFVTQFLC